jgi:hypothetical protein
MGESRRRTPKEKNRNKKYDQQQAANRKLEKNAWSIRCARLAVAWMMLECAQTKHASREMNADLMNLWTAEITISQQVLIRFECGFWPELRDWRALAEAAGRIAAGAPGAACEARARLDIFVSF